MKLFLFVLLSSCLFCQNLERFETNVRYLSSDKLKGRAYQSEGLDHAIDTIYSSLEQLNLPQIKIQEKGYNNKQVKNIIAIIPSKKKSVQSIVFTAHMDGLGIGKANIDGDSIYNGALDNAVGLAALIEFSAYFMTNQSASINYLFAFISPEETGLEGSEYLVKNFPFPKDQIKMVFNCDGFNVYGKMANYTIMPKSGISFYATISKIIKENHFSIFDPNWIDYMNTKFDTKSFLVQNIPAVTIWAGNQYQNKTVEESSDMKIFGKRHHSVDDEVADNWNWEGVREQFQLMLKIIHYYEKSKDKEKVINPSLFE